MSIDQYLLFTVITSIFLVSPGPSVLLSINNGVKYGIKRSSFAVLGNVAAFQILIILSALGLGAVLTASGEIFTFLKILGAIYLVYLGVKIWFSPIAKMQKGVSTNDKYSNRYILFKQAFFVTSSNPKALVYVSALLPQFINTQQALLPQVITLALISAVIQFIIFMSYVILSSKAKSWLENPNKRKIFNKFSGLTFIGFGVALGLSENKI
jgi:threonine/homoserine/homoserine lactone efflux protein